MNRQDRTYTAIETHAAYEPDPKAYTGEQFVILDQSDGVRCDQAPLIGVALDWLTVDVMVREYMSNRCRPLGSDQRVPWVREPDMTGVWSAHLPATYLPPLEEGELRSSTGISDHICFTVYLVQARGGEHPEDLTD